MLVRARKQLPGIAAALRERGLPVEVVGLGGLLEVPEVSDVVATLTVLVDPTAGDALGRLLTGARWRIGPRDLAALEARARALVHSRRPARPPSDGRRRSWRRRPERGSIVEALDDLGGPDAYSAGGLPPAAAARRRSWRTCATGSSESLPDLVDEVARTLGLETELASAPGASPAGARAHLDALHGVAAEFTELAELPSLPAFLGYLRDAEERERGLEPGEVAVNPEAVQLLTGHSAKGLEWDVVAVPGHDQGPVPVQGRHQRLLDQRPGRRARRPAAHRPRGAAPAAPAGAGLRRPGGREGRRSRTTSRSGRTSGSARRSASATSRSPAPGTCCSARAAGGATA